MKIHISYLIYEIQEQIKTPALPKKQRVALCWPHLLFQSCSKYMFWSREEAKQFLSSLILKQYITF